MIEHFYKRNKLTTRRITVVDGVCVAFRIADNFFFGDEVDFKDLSFSIRWKGPDRIMRQMIKDYGLYSTH